MPQETEQFSCPTCGMHAPMDRLYEESPFPFRLFRKILGGKRKLTDEEKELRKGGGFQRGSAPGTLSYDEIEMTDEARNQLRARLEESLEELGG